MAVKRACILIVLFSILPLTVLAQAPEIGRIALYADSLRTTSEVHQSAPYIPFDVYIFLQPSENGMYCAEFALDSSTESMVIASQVWHENISVSLGDLATGLSTCFLDCQTDWICLVKLSMINTITDPATLDIIRHPGVGYYQFANCLGDIEIEPVFVGPQFCYNQTCTQDTDPPVPTSVTLDDDWHLYVHFSEKVFEPDALDFSNYHIYATDNPGDSLAVTFTQFQGDEDVVWIALDRSMTPVPYMLKFRNLRDITGNPAPPETGITFGGIDTTPPLLLRGYSSNITTVVLIFSEYLDEASAENTSNYSIVCSGCPVTPHAYAAELQVDGMTVHLTLDSPIVPDVLYEVQAQRIADEFGNLMHSNGMVSFSAADFSPPHVTSLAFVADTALNIQWSEEIEQASAEDLSNYLLNKIGPPLEPMDILSAALDGGRTVRLDFSPAIDQDETYMLFVSGVMDTSGMVMLPDSFFIVPNDTIPPHMISAGCNGLMEIEIIFSEPIDNGIAGHAEYFQVFPTLDPDEPVALSGVALFDGDTRVSLYLAEELEVEIEYTVRAIGISDIAGNTSPLLQRAFECEDIYPPELLEIILPDLTHVNVLFNEIVGGAAGDPASYLVYLASDSAATADIDSVTMHVAGTRAELHLAAPLTLGELYTLRMPGVCDVAGNMIDPGSNWSFEARENVVPSLVNLTVTSDSIVHLEFDEPLDPVTAEDISNYAVVEASDTSAQLPLRSAVLDSGTIVHLHIDGGAETGTVYTAWIHGVTDLSGNALYTESEEFVFIDDIAPRLISAEAMSARNVVVYFDEAVSSTTAGIESNFTLHIAGDPSAEVDIFQSERRPDQMSVDLVLGGDLDNLAFYSLKVSGIDDLAGNTAVPDSAGFQYVDDRAPVILEIELVNSLRLSIIFNEPVDSATAVDTGNYSIFCTAAPSDQIDVTSADWLGAEVRLNLGAEPAPNADYTVIIDGVEDRCGNATSGLEGHFTNVVYVPSAAMYLYADQYRTTNEVDPDGIYDPFSFYVFVQPGGNGVFGVEYALSMPQTYLTIGHELNTTWVSAELGNPYAGHSVALSMCATAWIWAVRVDCLSLEPDEQEIVWFYGGIIASCLPGHPLEAVMHTQPLLINVQYVGVMVDNWDASFKSGGVVLNWSIRETEDVPDFEVSRTLDGSDSWQQLPAGLVHGDGMEFTATDTDLEPGRSYRYRVEFIENDGRKVLFETDAIATPAIPLTLRQNSPNPFNPSTSISFYLPQAGHVRLEIYDVNGRLVDVLADAQFAGGEHSVDWDGRDRGGSSVSSGVYFYRLIAGKESLSRKMVLLR